MDATCQSDFGISFNHQCTLEDIEEIPTPASAVDIFSEEEIHRQDFKVSMQKLDHLISVLNNVYGLCKKNQSISNQSESTQVEKVAATSDGQDCFSFNVNIREDNFVHCHAEKGKFYLKIIDSAKVKSKLNPFGLHRCSPTLEITRDFSKNDLTKLIRNYSFKSKKISSDVDIRKSFQLHRSFHTLPSHLGQFSKNLLDHILTIKTEVQALKEVFGNAECIWDHSDMSRISFKVGDISKWLVQTKTELGKSLLSPEDVKFMNGKRRASTFCRFYKMVKATNTTTKKKKKRAITK